MKEFVVIAVLYLIGAGCVSATSNSGIEQSDEEVAAANLNLGVGCFRQAGSERALQFNSTLSDPHRSLAMVCDQLGVPEEAEASRIFEVEPSATP
jgi:Tfp pilus assembly protein PilF